MSMSEQDQDIQLQSHKTKLKKQDVVKSRWRLMGTGLGGLALFWASWAWGSAEMTRWSLLPGFVIAVVGLLCRIWATGWLCKNDILATQGPYAYTRNPLYLGTFLLSLGQSLMSGLFFAPILFPALLLLFYIPTMRHEEEYLAGRYGIVYEEYRKRVPLLFPRLWPASKNPSSPSSFDWSRVRRCYKGFLGNAFVIGLYAWLALT
jgi:protein-S-isoprenylcysteine O-methyltransferase Ste14